MGAKPPTPHPRFRRLWKNQSIQIGLSQEIHLSSRDLDRVPKKVSQFRYSYMLLSPQVLQIKSKNDVLENDMQLYKQSNVELCLKASYQFLLYHLLKCKLPLQVNVTDFILF